MSNLAFNSGGCSSSAFGICAATYATKIMVVCCPFGGFATNAYNWLVDQFIPFQDDATFPFAAAPGEGQYNYSFSTSSLTAPDGINTGSCGVPGGYSDLWSGMQYGPPGFLGGTGFTLMFLVAVVAPRTDPMCLQTCAFDCVSGATTWEGSCIVPNVTDCSVNYAYYIPLPPKVLLPTSSPCAGSYPNQVMNVPYLSSGAAPWAGFGSSLCKTSGADFTCPGTLSGCGSGDEYP